MPSSRDPALVFCRCRTLVTHSDRLRAAGHHCTFAGRAVLHQICKLVLPGRKRVA